MNVLCISFFHTVHSAVWKNEKFSLTEIDCLITHLSSKTKFLSKKCEREFPKFPHYTAVEMTEILNVPFLIFSTGEAYRVALEEHNELVQQLMVKNKHIKDIIDQMRNIIWEINTMLAMR